MQVKASLGKFTQVGAMGNPGFQAGSSWASQVWASLGKLGRWEILNSMLLVAGQGKAKQLSSDGKLWIPHYWQVG